MSGEWVQLSELRLDTANGIEARATFEQTSPWFSGHFPEQPILPGVALLSLVADLIRRQGERLGRKMEICGLNRVRFKGSVRPGEEVQVTVRPGGRDSYVFTINSRERLIVQGVMEARASREAVGESL
ncbi:MAG: hypothetical protein AB1641_17130 [Thermodesulfobacteriota bacterium]